MMLTRRTACGAGLGLLVTALGGAWPVSAQTTDSVSADKLLSGIGADPNAANLGAFTAPVILPPAGLPPLAGLPVMQKLAFTVATSAGPGANYLMILGNGSGDYGASIFAIMGPQQSWLDLPDCDGSSSYCTGVTARGYTEEAFGGLQIRGDPSGFVGHTIKNDGSPGGELWDANWYDPAAGANYALTIYAPLCSAYGPLGAVDDSNRAGAQQIAELANQLVVWNRK